MSPPMASPLSPVRSDQTGMAFRVIFVSLLMVLTALSAAQLSPVAVTPAAAPDLEAMLPDEFGGWRRTPLGAAVLPAESELGPGEAVAYRAYQDDLGRIITLVAAYGPPLGDSVRLHRPESCYVAQGFAIVDRTVGAIETSGGKTPVVRLAAQSPSRKEAVTYWLRSGPGFVTSAPESQLIVLRSGFGKPLDGALIRVSTIYGGDPLFDAHERFLREFAAALDDDARALFLGAPSRSQSVPKSRAGA